VQHYDVMLRSKRIQGLIKDGDRVGVPTGQLNQDGLSEPSYVYNFTNRTRVTTKTGWFR